MALTDGMIGASVPLAVGFAVWVAKQFVHQEAEQRGPEGRRGERGPSGADGADLTVHAYKQLSDLLITQFNGRYMLANEARERFGVVEAKIDKVLLHLAK